MIKKISLSVVKKIFVVCLVALIISMSVLVSFAADTTMSKVELSKENIVVYPTVDGEIYYTQKVGERLTLVGGKVTTDGTETGTVVPGHFEFMNPDYMPAPDVGLWASIKFVPEDADSYIGFDIELCEQVIFDVNKATMEFVDPTAVPTATDVVAGKRLTTSDITGIDVKCQLTGEVLTSAKWSWEKSSTKVNESGYFPAKVTCSGYESISVYIYVRTEGDTSAPVISEFPTIEPIIYRDGLTAANLTIVGGETAIPGTFTFADPNQTLKGGNNNVTLVFTPEDTNENAVNITIVVNVGKIISTFIDENGNAFVPEIRFPIGYDLNFTTLKSQVERLMANCGKFTIKSFSGISYDTSATAEYNNAKVAITPANTNYSNEISFKLIIEPKEITPTISVYGNDEYEIRVGGEYTINPKGTFDFYVDDELVVEGIKYGKRFTWRPEKSGTYNLKAVYNPVENDTFKVNDAVKENMELNLTWKINCINCGAYDYKYGETATVMHSLGNQFAGWVFYDENGNEFTPENVVADESTSSVKFTMPDFSLTVKAKIVGEADDSVDSDDNSGSAGSTSIFSRFIEFLRNLFEKYINIFKTVFGMFAPAN